VKNAAGAPSPARGAPRPERFHAFSAILDGILDFQPIPVDAVRTWNRLHPLAHSPSIEALRRRTANVLNDLGSAIMTLAQDNRPAPLALWNHALALATRTRSDIRAAVATGAPISANVAAIWAFLAAPPLAPNPFEPDLTAAERIEEALVEWRNSPAIAALKMGGSVLPRHRPPPPRIVDPRDRSPECRDRDCDTESPRQRSRSPRRNPFDV